MLGFLQELLQANLATYLAEQVSTAVAADASFALKQPLTAPDPATGYIWGRTPLPQRRANGIQIFLITEEDMWPLERKTLNFDGPADQRLQAGVRWSYLARHDELEQSKALRSAAVRKAIREKWHEFEVTLFEDPGEISVWTSVSYEEDSLRSSDQATPGVRGVDATTHDSIDTFTVRVHVEQRLQNVIST